MAAKGYANISLKAIKYVYAAQQNYFHINFWECCHRRF